VKLREQPSTGLTRYLALGAIQGLAAWSAYAVLEFLASSVLFRLGRPYARFTTWHWTLTGELAAAYLVHGIFFGALAGLIVFFFRHSPRLSGGQAPLVIEHAATLTLTVALALDILRHPLPPDGWWKLWLVPLVLSAILLLALRSEAWSRRFGLLTNPWLMAGLFLGFGQMSTLEDLGVAGQFGVPLRLWYYVLLVMLLLVAVATAWFGRRWRQASNSGHIFWPNWAATALALVLMGVGFGLGIEPGRAMPRASIAGASSRPNVMLIVMDTVRADHLSVYGYQRDTTPNLKKLAADSMLFPQALSAADITLTSHASIFTGLYPSWHGAYCQPPDASFGRRIGPVPTLAEALGQNGYHNLGVAANLYLRADFGLQRGFADFRIPRPVPVLAGDESWYMLRYGMRQAINLVADTSQFDRLYSRGDAVNGEFFRMLGDPKLAQAPFFAFFNYMDAHYPYMPPRPFDHLFPGKTSATEGDLDEIQMEVSQKGEPLPPLYTSHAVSQYDGGIAYIDSQIGQLVDWLKRQGLYDDTMIVVTADHGEAFGERRLFLHGNSLYANLLHVGLLVKYPHSSHKGVVDTPVSLIDVFPTVLKVIGVNAPAGLQGIDVLDPAATATRALFSESYPCPVPHGPQCPGGCLMRSVVSWPNKFIFSSGGSPETYQLLDDPNENRNLFGSLNKTAQALSEELRRWVKTMPPQEAQHINLSPEEIKRFKALGYIQ